MASEYKSGGDCFDSGAYFSINGVHGAPHSPPGWETGVAEGNKGLFAQLAGKFEREE